jgi:DNA-binding FadR family transcriptional regulator
MNIEAMQQALNALEYHTMQTRPIHHTDKAIEALRQAIEQAEKQEPRKEWVGLTDEEVSETIDAVIGFNSCWGPETAFARAIEAKLKEKNGGS